MAAAGRSVPALRDHPADRYPAIFSFVREQLGAGEGLRLLSFGCATGEEVFTLRHYFPDAFIKGIDIDRHNVAIAARRRAHPTSPSRLRAQHHGEAAESYDAIFCMAVLRHADLTEAERCDPLLRFEDFERAVGDLARCLKPGGLIAFRHSNFRFGDTAVATGFDTMLRLAPNARTALFGRDNRRLHGVADARWCSARGLVTSPLTAPRPVNIGLSTAPKMGRGRFNSKGKGRSCRS